MSLIKYEDQKWNDSEREREIFYMKGRRERDKYEKEDTRVREG